MRTALPETTALVATAVSDGAQRTPMTGAGLPLPRGRRLLDIRRAGPQHVPAAAAVDMIAILLLLLGFFGVPEAKQRQFQHNRAVDRVLLCARDLFFDSWNPMHSCQQSYKCILCR